MGVTAANWILTQPWAMLPEMIETIVSIADRTNDLDAVIAKRGEPLANTHFVEMHNGVAVIPVHGPISRYADRFTEISGATSVDTLAADLYTAISDSAVKGIVLEYNTPGGQAAGIGELASQIYEYGKTKPVISYVSNLGASAGLWLASAGTKVVLAPQAIMGSMGVLWPVSRPTEKDTARTLEFVSSQSPNKRPDVETDAGRAEMQRVVDDMAQVFIEQVAAYRKLDPAKIAKAFGSGGLAVGRKAVECGMADRLGTLEACISDARKGHMKKINLLKMFTGLMNKGVGAEVDAEVVHSTIQEMSGDEAVSVPVAEAEMETDDVPNTEDVAAKVARDDANAVEFDARVETIRAELRKEILGDLRKGRIDLYGQHAEAFLSLHSAKVIPAEVAGLKSAFVAAALIDAESPIEGFSVLGNFTTSVSVRKPHGLTEEIVTGDAAAIAGHLSGKNLKVMDNAAASPDEASQAASAARIEAMLASTEEGRHILAMRKAAK